VYVAEGIIAALIVVVIVPAVWSRLEWRRKAAKAVLDSILRAVGKVFAPPVKRGEDGVGPSQGHESD
jgi:hypothetical protein